METLYYTRLKTPVGVLLLAGTSAGIARIEFGAEPPSGAKPSDRALACARRELEEYFAGKRRSFGLELALGGTEFQRAVWTAVRQVPYGATLTYRELARRVGRPQAVRAVGAANGQNPLSIVIPCHRIVGSDGALRGYGGGLEVKQFLLELEGARPKEIKGPKESKASKASKASKESKESRRAKGG